MPYKRRRDHALYMRKWRKDKAFGEGRVYEPRYSQRKYHTKAYGKEKTKKTKK